LCINRLTEISKHLQILDTACLKNSDLETFETKITNNFELKIAAVFDEIQKKVEQQGRIVEAVEAFADQKKAKDAEPREESAAATISRENTSSASMDNLAKRLHRIEEALSMHKGMAAKQSHGEAQEPDLQIVDSLSTRLSSMERDLRASKRQGTTRTAGSIEEVLSSPRSQQDVRLAVPPEPQKEDSKPNFAEKDVDDLKSLENDTLGYGEEGHRADPSASQTWSFQESIWDCSFFIFHPVLGWGESIHVLMLLLLNILTMAIFLAIVYVALAQENYTDAEIEGYKVWRRNIGQHVKYYDKLTFTALSERICLQDTVNYPVEMSDSKASDIGLFQAYLPDFENQGFLAIFISGPMLCLVSLMAWSLTVMQYVHSILRGASAMWYLPKTSRTRVLKAGEGFKVESVSRSRFVFFEILLVCRFTICCTLWYGGCVYIAQYSIALGDILLNSVALAVVLGIDANFYQLVSARMKNLISNIEPVPGPRNRCKLSGVDLKAILLFVWLIGGLFWIMMQEVLPLMGRISKAQTHLCGGNSSFVYSLDPFYLVYSSDSNPWNKTLAELMDFPHIEAIEELIYPDSVPNVKWYDSVVPAGIAMEFLGQGVSPVQRVSIFNQKEATDNLQDMAGTICGDAFTLVIGLNRYVHDTFVERGITVNSCNDLLPYCTELEPLARVACSKTCGCDDPSGRLMLAGPVDGCPSSCMSTVYHKAVLKNMPCTEKPPSEMQSDVAWADRARQMGTKLTQVLTHPRYQDEMRNLCKHGNSDCTLMFQTMGCSVVEYWKEITQEVVGSPHNLCTGDFLGSELKTRPFSIFCPETCGCKGSGKNETADALVARYCPGTCPP